MSADILGTSCDQCRSTVQLKSLRPRKPEGSLGRTAQDVHLDSHTAPELWRSCSMMSWCLMSSDVIWHIRDKLWPMPKHGSVKATYVRCMRVLAVTCHLHFWQNDRDFLRATVVTRGWNGYRNKSQHRKSTLEKKILPPFQQGFEPATFQSRVRRSNHWAIPAPSRSCSFILLPLYVSRFGLAVRR